MAKTAVIAALAAAALLTGCASVEGMWPWGAAPPAEPAAEPEGDDAPRASPSTPVQEDSLDPVASVEPTLRGGSGGA